MSRDFRDWIRVLVACAALYAVLPVAAQDEEEKPETTFTIGGFAKLDFMMSVFQDGEPPVDNPIRDIHFPGAIPIGGEETFDTHFHVKESRFYIDVASELLGKPVHAYFEMDFLLSLAGDQRISNSYNPRMRQFYFDFGNWTLGQTWSTFMIVVIPDDLDFAGAAEGLIFNRQPLIRYTAGDWQFSMENPETTLTPSAAGGLEVSSGGLPDFVVRRNFSGNWGNGGIAGIFRNPRYYDDGGERRDFIGYGITGAAKVKTTGRDDLRVMTAYGRGLGRYAGLGFTNSALIDTDLELEPIESLNGFVSYLHHWNDKWRSSVNYSFFEGFNPEQLDNSDVNRRAWSGSANVIVSPAAPLFFGLEFMYGYREWQTGDSGSFYRFQFSARYAFKYTNKSN